MKGIIRSFAPEKKYGFIKGDDGKDYFFHEEAFSVAHRSRICDEARVEFEQNATPKGYRAENCALIEPSHTEPYVTPDDFPTSKSEGIKGWEIIETGNWFVIGTSRDSPEAARRDMIDGALSIGANALIETMYFKTTGSEGNYQFTIHNFRGRVVTVAKRNAAGNYGMEDLTGLNERAEKLKQRLVEQELERNRKIKMLIWIAVGIVSIALLLFFWKNGIDVSIHSMFPTIFVGVILLMIFWPNLMPFGISSASSDWLQRADSTSNYGSEHQVGFRP